MAKWLSEPARRLLFRPLLILILVVGGIFLAMLIVPTVYYLVGNSYMTGQIYAETQAAIAKAREQDTEAGSSPAVVESMPSPQPPPQAQETSPPDSGSSLTPDQAALVSGSLRGMAESWLAQIDQGKYAEAYGAQSDGAKALEPLDYWKQYMQIHRAPDGSVVSRSFSNASVLQDDPDEPPTYVLNYATTFQNSKALETVQLQQSGDGTWHYIAYNIVLAP
jgi:hypothetical protein